MTPNLSSLPTREIDALVAEKVMGWKMVNNPGAISGWDNYQLQSPEGRWGELVPSFSTSITHAMDDVVAKMKAEGWLVTINDDGDKWCVEFHVRDFESGISVDAEHESLPTCICLAALECKGVKHGNV